MDYSFFFYLLLIFILESLTYCSFFAPIILIQKMQKLTETGPKEAIYSDTP